MHGVAIDLVQDCVDGAMGVVQGGEGWVLRAFELQVNKERTRFKQGEHFIESWDPFSISSIKSFKFLS